MKQLETAARTPTRPAILPDTWFVAGDVVSRDGTDEHLVVSTNEGGSPGYPPDLILVECIKEPEPWTDGTVWCRIGEREDNVATRYSLVRRASGTVSKMGRS